MPPRKRDAFAAAVPIAKDVIDDLRDQDKTIAADAVQTVLTFATEAADAAARKAARDTSDEYRSRSIYMPKAYREYVRAAAKAAKPPVDLNELAREKLGEFIEGAWTPPRPPKAPHGQTPPKAFFSVRVSDALWDRAHALAKDSEASEERGYKLTAQQVVIAAFLQRFPAPEDEPAER